MSGKTIAIGVGAFAVGAVGGYILGKQLTIKKLEDWANDEIAKVRERYRGATHEEITTGNQEFDTPEAAAAVLIGDDVDPDQKALREFGKDRVNDLMVANGYPPLSGFEDQSASDKVETLESMDLANKEEVLTEEEAAEYNGEQNPLEGLTGEVIVESIWSNGAAATGEVAVVTDAPEVEDESETPGEFIPKRHPSRPYVIPQSWYDSDEEGYDKKNLTYFEEDEVLIDEGERPVPNKDEIVGTDNLFKFGVGTKDRNTVYVRSEKRTTDYEVIRDKRSYTEVIHGEPPQRESSAPRKMRSNDE